MFKQTTVHNFQPQFLKKRGEKSKWFKVCVECGKEEEQNDLYFHPPVSMSSMKDENSPQWASQPTIYNTHLDCEVLHYARQRMYQNIQIVLTDELRADYEVERFRSDVLNFLPLRFCVVAFEDSKHDIPMVLYRSRGEGRRVLTKFAFVPLYELDRDTVIKNLLSTVRPYPPLRTKLERRHPTVYGHQLVINKELETTHIHLKATIQNAGNNSIVHFESGSSKQDVMKYAVVEMNLQGNFV